MSPSSNVQSHQAEVEALLVNNWLRRGLYSAIVTTPLLCLSRPSYYLYTYDKMVAPNVSLRGEAEMSAEMLGTLLKQHYSRRGPAHDEPPMGE